MQGTGGLLEVVITEAESKRPVEKASVSIQHKGTNEWFNSISGEDGIVRMYVMPGEYQMQATCRQGLMSARHQEAVTIEYGKMVRIEWQLTGQRKVAGVVRDEGNKPMEGVKLRICPIGRQDATSDAEGRFVVGWDPRDSHGSETLIRFLVGRYEEDNLAAAVEIGEDTETLDIKLEPGVILTGKVTDPDGKGIEGAAVRVFVRGPNWDLSLVCDQAKTDAEGAFEVKAIPAEHKYDVCMIAEGYGEGYVTVNTDDAVDNRLDIGVLTLPLANHSV